VGWSNFIRPEPPNIKWFSAPVVTVTMEKRLGTRRREGYIVHLLSHAVVIVQLAVRLGTSPIRKVGCGSVKPVGTNFGDARR
jgi:hypothetical protein